MCDGEFVEGYGYTPDLRGRFILGSGHSTGLSAREHGTYGGNETHTLTINEMPAHNHTMDTAGSHNHTVSGGSHNHTVSSTAHTHTVSNTAHTHTVGDSGGHTHGINNKGGGGAHNIMPPFFTLVYIIKVF